MFKELPISSSTLYDDEAGIQAEELPRLVGALGLYGFDHILLHKDYLTSYRMAWDYERYKVSARSPRSAWSSFSTPTRG